MKLKSLNGSDQKLCKEIARIWVESGGDEEGIDWCFQAIKDAIKEEIKEKMGVE